MRKFPPLKPDHPVIVDGTCCGLCGEPFQAGDEVTLLPGEPASDEDAAFAAAGRPYTAAAEVVHWHCWDE